MENKDLYLERLPYWENLTQRERDTVRDNSVIQLHGKGQIIQGCSNECIGMLLVLKGSVRIYILSEEGREVTLFRLHAGDTCVLSASCVISQITFDTQMVTEENSAFLVVNSDVFASLGEQNIYVRCFMYELMTEHFSAVMWSLQQILFMGYDRRLASFLVGEYDRTGLAEIKMTHEQIAQHTSSAREVVARMLKRFVSEDLVMVKRGSIRLQNIAALRSMI